MWSSAATCTSRSSYASSEPLNAPSSVQAFDVLVVDARPAHELLARHRHGEEFIHGSGMRDESQELLHPGALRDHILRELDKVRSVVLDGVSTAFGLWNKPRRPLVFGNDPH